MKRLLALLLLIPFTTSGLTLWEFYGGNLPSISQRAQTYGQYFSDSYKGTAKQNTQFLASLQGRPKVNVADLAVDPSEYYLLNSGLNLGAQNAVGGRVYSLSGSGVSSSGTSLGLTSFKVAGADIKLGMSDFGDLGCGTVEPGNATRQEFVSFTGVTQNADGTATLTGISRGLSPVSPYTASTTQQRSHSGASQFVISNSPPCFYQNYASRTASTTVTAIWQFDVLPESTQVATTTNQFTTKTYVDNTVSQGAATSTESRGGISELGTLAEQASSYDGGATQPTVLQTKNSTSTCQIVGSYNIVASSTTGKLDKGCFDQTASYTLSGTTSFTGATSFSSATTTLSATTSIAASSSNKLVLNTISYSFPSSAGASSTVLSTDGSGGLTWNTIADIGHSRLLLASTTGSNLDVGTSEQTIFNYSLDGGSLSTGNVARVTCDITMKLNHSVTGISKTVTMRYKYGGTTMGTITLTTISNTSANSLVGRLEFSVMGDGGTSAQNSRINVHTEQDITTPNTGALVIHSLTSGASAIDSTTAQNIAITGQISADVGEFIGLTINKCVVELLK